MSWGRRLGRGFRWIIILVLLGGVAGSIIYEVMFAPPPRGTLSASCVDTFHALESALTEHSSAIVASKRLTSNELRHAFYVDWDRKLAVARGQCTDPRSERSGESLERIRYAHESLLDRFERELVPLRDELASSLTRP